MNVINHSARTVVKRNSVVDVAKSGAKYEMWHF